MSHPVRFIDDGCAGCNLNKRRYVAYVEKMSHLLDVFFFLFSGFLAPLLSHILCLALS